MQIKMTLRDSILFLTEWLRSKTQVIAHTGEDVEQGEHSSIVGRSANLYNLWKSIRWFLRKLGIVLPQDPAIPLLDTYLKAVPLYDRNTCSTVFIAALFVIVRNWKQPRGSSIGKWMKKL